MKKAVEASRSWAFILYPREGSKFSVEERCALLEHRPSFSLDYLRYIVGSPVHSPDSSLEGLAYFGDSDSSKQVLDSDPDIALNAEDAHEIEPFKEHIHILINFPRRVRQSSAQYVASTAFKDFAPSFTQVFRVGCERSYFRYLIHLDNIEKQQFLDVDETSFVHRFFNSQAIDSNISRWYKRQHRYMTDAESREADIIFIEKLIEEGECGSLWELVRYFSEVADSLAFYNSLYVEFRTLIRRNKSYFETLCNHFAVQRKMVAKKSKNP